MTLDDTFNKLASFLNSLDAEGEQKFELSHSLVIICPDCGKNIAFRGRCPKCASNSWIPAGHTGGIFEQMKAQRLREMISSPDDTASIRGEGSPAPLRGAQFTAAVADEAVAYAASQAVAERDPDVAVASATLGTPAEEFEPSTGNPFVDEPSDAGPSDVAVAGSTLDVPAEEELPPSTGPEDGTPRTQTSGKRGGRRRP